MYALKKLMIGVDFSSMDDTLLSYTAFICKILKPEKLTLIHIIPFEELDIEVLREYRINEHYHAEIRNSMDKLVSKHKKEFGNLKIEKIIMSGNPLHELLRFARDEEIDLAIVGEKNIDRGAGIVSQRFARKAPCSTLFVTENAKLRLKKVLLPTDFSEYSKMAFEEVKYFHNEFPGTKILVQHIYKVPLGYYTTGKSFEEFAQIMENNSRKEYENYIKSINAADLPLEPHFTLGEHNNASRLINDLADKEEVDLVIIGAKGHTRASALLLGSTTEKFMKMENRTPVLVLKNKGETLGFLETVLHL